LSSSSKEGPIFVSPFASNMDEHKLGCKGSDVLQELEILTMNAKAAQELILGKILEKNQATEYLNKFMNGSADISAFKSQVPVVTYDVVQPYIARIAGGGESSILCGEKIVELLRRCASLPHSPSSQCFCIRIVKV
jgi:auxin responsive GH3 family protein